MNKIIKSTLNDIIDNKKNSLISGPFGSNISAKFFVEKGIPVIRGNNLSLPFEKFNDNGFVFITEKKANELNCFANVDDLIFTIAGSLGQVGIIPINALYKTYVISNKQARATLNVKKIDILYAYYWFSSPWMKKYLIKNNKGTTVPLLTLNELKMLPINYPEDISTQKKISHLLDLLTIKISINNKIISKLESMAKIIYDYWFVQFDFPNENNKPYKKSGGEMVKTELGKIPAGWKVGTINNISKEVICGKTPTTKNKENYGTEIPFITIPDMHNNIYIIKTQKYLSNKGANTQVAKNVPENTICVSCIATVGLVALTSTCSQTNQQINSIIPKKEITPYWVYFYIKNIREVIVNNALGGTTTLNLNKTSFENINIIIPDIHILKKFHNNVKPIFEKIKFTSIENQKLAEIRDFLLPLLMNGQANIE